jgi:hypothetical protein
MRTLHIQLQIDLQQRPLCVRPGTLRSLAPSQSYFRFIKTHQNLRLTLFLTSEVEAHIQAILLETMFH